MTSKGGFHNMSAIGSRAVGRAFGYLFEDEIEAFKVVVDGLPNNSICINIGAGSGTSGLIFMESKRCGKLYTIDLYKKGRPEGALENELNAFKDAGFFNDARHRQIQGDSSEVGISWNHGLVDMVFVDGDHSYEHCMSDICAWLPNIKGGGILAFHDYEARVWPGVKKSVDEILREFEVVSYVNTFIAFRL